MKEEPQNILEHQADATSNAAASRDKLWTPLFVLIILTALCSFMVGQGLNAGTSVYLAEKGYGAVLAGIMGAVFSVAAGVARLFCGAFADKHGRWVLMLSGVVMLTLGTAAPLLELGVGALLVWRAVQGVGFSIATTVLATMAADVIPLSRLGEGIGYYGLGQAVAMSMGPAFGLFLVQTDSVDNLFLGLFLLGVVACIFGAFCRYEKNMGRLPAQSSYRVWKQKQAEEANAGGPAVNESRGFWGRMLEKKAMSGALPLLIVSPAMGFSIFFVGLYGTSLGVTSTGLYFTLSAVAMILMRIFSGRFMDSVAPIKIYGVGTVFGIVAFACLSLVSFVPETGQRLALLCVAGLLYGVFMGVVTPICQAVAVKCSPQDRWGAANALVLLAIDVGIGIAIVLWGFFNDAFGFTISILLCIICFVAALACARITFPKR